MAAKTVPACTVAVVVTGCLNSDSLKLYDVWLWSSQNDLLQAAYMYT